LAIGINRGGVWSQISRSKQYLEKFRGSSIIVLSKAKELAKRLLQKPIEISGPVKPLALNDHSKALVNEEWTTHFSRRLIITIDGNNHLKVSERLLLKRP
jgi:hypothetical protein